MYVNSTLDTSSTDVSTLDTSYTYTYIYIYIYTYMHVTSTLPSRARLRF